MIPIDLITGFLGSGKTTFMIAYANYLVQSGKKVGIIVNDLGAVNVDMLMLSSQLGDRCALEMITNSPDQTTYQRRLKTKLIALGMQGYDRVLIEPSGIFDVDTFFDVLYDAPLDSWYEIGNVLALVDATLPTDLSKASRYVLASEIACAGRVILTHLDQAAASQVKEISQYLKQCLQEVSCRREMESLLISVPWQSWTSQMWDVVIASGYTGSAFVHHRIDPEEVYGCLYYLQLQLPPKTAHAKLQTLFENEKYGRVYRVKGFVHDSEDQWYQINATAHDWSMVPSERGQDVLIVIGEALQNPEISKYLNGKD